MAADGSHRTAEIDIHPEKTSFFHLPGSPAHGVGIVTEKLTHQVPQLFGSPHEPRNCIGGALLYSPGTAHFGKHQAASAVRGQKFTKGHIAQL